MSSSYFSKKSYTTLTKIYSNILYCGLFHDAVSGAAHVARTGEWAAYTGFWWGNLRERDHLGDPDVDGRISLRWIFRK
jgi:hypothetical protein